MNEKLVQRIAGEVEEIKASGLYKIERIIASPQGAEIIVNGETVLNFCANNYLGLSSHPKVIAAAHKAIEDRGYGIPETELPRIVDPFFRSDDARTRGIGGTGLGLSIVHKIANAFGAKLLIESSVGHGSSFAIVFQTVASQQLHCA